MKKKVLITGGTGTIGSAFIDAYGEKYDFYSLSRNEKVLSEFNRNFPSVKTYIGPIEDLECVDRVYDKIRPDIVIHAAAMKHINLIEKEPIQACKVNVVGSLNVIAASRKYSVPLTVSISTDKACSSESVYGDTKYLMERCFMEANTDKIRFASCRFANVAHSNGSVLPFWLKLKEKGLALKLTDSKMNRLMFSKKEASDLIMKTIKYAEKYGGGFVGITKMKTVNMMDLARVISNDIEIVGLRPGEKLDEDLISERELPYTRIIDNYVTIETQKNNATDRLKYPYNSSTAEPMTFEEMKKMVEE